jgi:molybdopterin converting factor small subunit
MSTTTDTPTVTVRIPTPLRSYVDDQAQVDVAGTTVDDVLRSLVDQYPDLADNLYNEDDQLRQFVNVYLDDEDIRYLDGVGTAIDGAGELSIVPSIAGGACRA